MRSLIPVLAPVCQPHFPFPLFYTEFWLNKYETQLLEEGHLLPIPTPIGFVNHFQDNVTSFIIKKWDTISKSVDFESRWRYISPIGNSHFNNKWESRIG